MSMLVVQASVFVPALPFNHFFDRHIGDYVAQTIVYEKSNFNANPYRFNQYYEPDICPT